MTRHPMTRHFAAVLLLGLALFGCGEDEPPAPASFPPLHYDYLKKLRLNVGTIDIQDQSHALGEADVSAQSPAPPGQALLQMAHDRLFAAGTTGQAVFTVEQASIVRQPGGVLAGEMDVRLDVTGGAGLPAGMAEARVARTHVPGSEPENQQTVLYDLTRQMMDEMNVELEYQLRRSLRGWLEGAAAVPAPVTVQPLPPAFPPLQPDTGGSPPPVAPPGTPVMPPGSLPEPEPEPPGPQEMSPPPGYLHLPGQPDPYQPPAQPQGAY
jgi:hypothetical protein